MKDRVLHKRVEFPTIREMMTEIAKMYGDKTAYSFRIKPNDAEAIQKSYNDLRDDVYALATELMARGYQGKHIALIGKLSYNWVLVYYATMTIGSVLVPLDRDWQAPDLADTVKKADADLLLRDLYLPHQTIKCFQAPHGYKTHHSGDRLRICRAFGLSSGQARRHAFLLI